MRSRAITPCTHRVYWSRARKNGIVRAVRNQAISFEEARERYLLSRSEFDQWEAEYLAAGGDAERMEQA
jgi:hypothetical protein